MKQKKIKRTFKKPSRLNIDWEKFRGKQEERLRKIQENQFFISHQNIYKDILSYLLKLILLLLIIWAGGEFFIFLQIPPVILARIAGGLSFAIIFFLLVIIPWETKRKGKK